MRNLFKYKRLILLFLVLGTPFIGHATCKAPERGPPGPRGPTGPAGPSFTPDVGSSLSFRNAYQPGGFVPAGSVLIPYVVAPNGVVTQGVPMIADGAHTDFLFDPIVILNPVFGTYHTGVQATLGGDFNPGLINLTSRVVSDRAGPAPAEVTLVGEEDTLNTIPFPPLHAGDQYQITADFAYGKNDIP